MKKVVLFTMFACMCIAGFAQQMITSTKNTVKLDNSAAVSFSQGSTYIYQITNTNLQIYKTEGSLKVADFFDAIGPTGGEPNCEPSGEIDLSFNMVYTTEGFAVKITSKTIDGDGLFLLKKAKIEVVEDDSKLNVNIKVENGRKAKVKTFEVLVS